MKQFYSAVLTVLTLTFFSFTSSAQSGGTYTAIVSGNWHTPTGPGVWQAAEPPQNCSNCLIVLNSGVSLNLNANVNLSNATIMQLASGATLTIGSSGATTFANSYSLIIVNDATGSKIELADASSLINAKSAGDFDGVLTAFPSGGSTTYFKQIGNAPNGFVNNTIANNGNASFGNLVAGPNNLNSVGTLPVILADFNAAVDNGSVNLSWTTDMEANSDHFTVQASSNAGEKWNDLGSVQAAGTSASPINYSFRDGHPADGTNEYRLVMVDRDGRTAYSGVRAVRFGTAATVNVYPNPATDNVNITLGGEANFNANIRLVNLAGQVMLERNVTNAGGSTVALSVSSLPAGNYLIVITGSDGSKQVNKILIAR
ncbi:MAG TPA: T9SS type A sorting domain-containing protein [Puia sp.]|nr:T9SS type A sorting domain-containing protein [Puia sp.]